MRSGKGALYVAEKLALEQFARDGSAVDLDQRRLASRAAGVDDMSHQFLAHAGLALDQYARRSLRHGLDTGEHLFQCRTLTDDAPEVHRHLDFLPQVIALPLQFLAQLGVFLEGGPQSAFGLISFGDVLHGHVHAPDAAIGVSLHSR